MSTNFYWHVDPVRLPTGEEVDVNQDNPKVHIGKRYGAGHGEVAFTYAQDPNIVRQICESNLHNPSLVVDEYGALVSATLMIRILDSCIRHEVDGLGQEWS